MKKNQKKNVIKLDKISSKNTYTLRFTKNTQS